jgi:hypothetical protein
VPYHGSLQALERVVVLVEVDKPFTHFLHNHPASHKESANKFHLAFHCWAALFGSKPGLSMQISALGRFGWLVSALLIPIGGEWPEKSLVIELREYKREVQVTYFLF